MATATGTLVSRLLANLDAISFFKRTLDNRITEADAYLRVTAFGTVALQNGRPQVDWTKVRNALAVVDPELLGPAAAQRERQYHDVLKNMRKRPPAPLAPVRDIFTPEQYTVLHSLMDLKFAELRAHIDCELAAIRAAAPVAAATEEEEVFPPMELDDSTGLFVEDYNDYTL